MDVEQRSRRLLVKWLTFCLAHQTYLKKHKLLSNYGIALSWQSLDVAVLREQGAIDALLYVTAYIRSWNERGCEPIFDLSNPAPTAHFAWLFAANSNIFVTRYTDEMECLGQRVTAQWMMLCEKKAASKTLKAEIKQLDSSLQRCNKFLNVEQARLSAQSKHLPYNTQQWQSPTTVQYAIHINDLTN